MPLFNNFPPVPEYQTKNRLIITGDGVDITAKARYSGHEPINTTDLAMLSPRRPASAQCVGCCSVLGMAVGTTTMLIAGFPLFLLLLLASTTEFTAEDKKGIWLTLALTVGGLALTALSCVGYSKAGRNTYLFKMERYNNFLREADEQADLRIGALHRNTTNTSTNTNTSGDSIYIPGIGTLRPSM